MNESYLGLLSILKSTIHNEELPVFDGGFCYNDILVIASKQNIFPMIYDSCSTMKGFDMEKYYNDWFRCAYIVSEQDRRTCAFIGTYINLVANGIKPVLMKGLFCRELYGRYSSYRPSADEDIWVSLEDYPKVSEILLNEGYEKKNSNQEVSISEVQEIGYYNKSTGLCLEVHINLFRKDGFILDSANDLFDDSKVVEWDYRGVTFYVMEDVYHLLYVVLHAYSHFLKGGIGVRQIVDILMFYHKVKNGIENGKLFSLLSKVDGARKFFNDVVGIGCMYLGFATDSMVEVNENDINRLLDNVLFGGVFGDTDKSSRACISTVKGTVVEGKRVGTVGLIFRSLFPRKEVLYSQYPELHKNAFKLPLFWCKRVISFSGKVLKKEVRVSDVLRKSKDKISLIDTYLKD